jgi:Domain of unknown function/Domain of unknown function (DUF4959)/Domain of unknown function (DUF5126)
MKNNLKLLLLYFISILSLQLVSCKPDDGDHVPVSTDKTKPGIITNIQVINYNGGAHIIYTLPNSDNLLYVIAKYQIRNGVSRETKASYFTDTITVEGFAKSADYLITLNVVTRANVQSDPITVKVHPDTPPYLLVRQSTTLGNDFGGVNIQSLNPLLSQVGLVVLAFDKSLNDLEIQDQHYTNVDTINYSLRGYSTDTRAFGVYITDQYGNVSDTLKQNITPIFEELLDKSKFSEFTLPTDSKLYTVVPWPVHNLWDGISDGSANGWHTDLASVAPFTCTFNVGASYKLSRFILWERPDNADGSTYAFEHGNPKYFTIWGSDVANPADVQLPVSSPVGTVLGDWVNLGNYTYPNPPSGLAPHAHNAADNAFVLAGVNFNIPLNAPPIHFIRFAVGQTWDSTPFAHIMELSFYGDPQ